MNLPASMRPAGEGDVIDRIAAAAPVPHQPDFEDEEEADVIEPDDGDDELDQDEEDVDEDLAPPPPRMATPASHRIVPKTSETATGSSFWLGKSREQLNAAAEERKYEMANTKEGRRIKGVPTADDRERPWTERPVPGRVNEPMSRRRC